MNAWYTHFEPGKKSPWFGGYSRSSSVHVLNVQCMIVMSTKTKKKTSENNFRRLIMQIFCFIACQNRVCLRANKTSFLVGGKWRISEQVGASGSERKIRLGTNGIVAIAIVADIWYAIEFCLCYWAHTKFVHLQNGKVSWLFCLLARPCPRHYLCAHGLSIIF